MEYLHGLEDASVIQEDISIRSESFAELLELQKRLPIRASIPQLIEWLIKVGQQNIKQSDNYYEDNRTIQRK